MGTQKVTLISRISLMAAAIMLGFVLKMPIWRIDLVAPQYPEGLNLLIHADGLKGNVDIINGLNHYIGMKTLHNEDFPEFRILPWCIIFFAAAFALVAIIGRRKWMNILLLLFVSFGIVAMIDFWRWEYNYGHNLDPNAAIIVPGMAYQPPLIGFKQLLNFGAYSIPDTGGWFFIAAGMILLLCVFFEWRLHKKKKAFTTPKSSSLALVLSVFFLAGCNRDPEPLNVGVDQCQYCKMIISDAKFGAALVNDNGKTFKFDDVVCLRSFKKENTERTGASPSIYITDFAGDHKLVGINKVHLLKTTRPVGPMNGNIIAFSDTARLKEAQSQFGGNVVAWDELKK